MPTYQARPLEFAAIMLGYIVYAVVILIYVGWLRHLFGRRVQRFGWFLLLGQLFLLTMHGWGIGPHSWWSYDGEGNIPVAFATFQMLVGSFSALVIAILAPLKPRWLRGYWAYLALGLYVLALDDFGFIHDRFPILEEFYLVGGVLLVVLSGVVWSRLEARQRLYLYLLIAGLGVGIMGAEVLDKQRLICAEFLQVFSQDCMRPHPLEETFEKLGSSFVVISMLGSAVAVVPAERWQRAQRKLLLSFSLPTLGLLVLMTIVNISVDWYVPPIIVRGDRYPHQTNFANGYRLDASFYRFDNEYEPESYLNFSLYGETYNNIERDFGYGVQIVDQVNGNVYAVHDRWSRKTAEEWQHERTILEDKQQLWLPEDIPGGRALWLVFSLWEQNAAGDFVTIPITASDQFQLSETQIVMREIIIAETDMELFFGDSFILRDTEIPSSAHAGGTLSIPMTWEAASDGSEDWMQFLHFVHEESGVFWNHDQPPLGVRLPIRLWYEGLRETEAWQITLPADLAPGRYAVYTGLYRLSDGARLPAISADGVLLPDARAPLGFITISE